VSVSARFCPTCGTALTPGAPSREEERKLVSILFADVTGSTALGERLDPERLRSLLSAYFSAMSSVIESWGGTVEKFIGDAVMAAFGVPTLREDDAERALRAGLEMMQRLEALNQGFERQHDVTLQIRIGVNTGEVIAPVGGPAEQLIVSGDAVNVAARLEQSAEPGAILAGERTYLATRGAFRFEQPIALDLKGKAERVKAWRLIEPLPEATRGVPGLRAEMVGRDRELATLAGLMEEAVETGRPRLVAVYGPAGIGKSRLTQEFLAKASASYSPLTLLRGRCLAAGQGVTYWALGEILRASTGIDLSDASDVAAEKLTRGIRDLLATQELDEADVEQTVFALATTAGIHLPGNPLQGMEPQQVANELSRAWPRFATAHASNGPTVFVVEDLHWAEDRLLDMLERFLARSMGPLLFVVTARPEFAESHPAFVSGREDASSVSLRPLTEQQSAQLVERLLAVAHLPAALHEEILAKAEGNPFFLEEIIRRLIDEGALVREGDGWRATEAAHGIVLPDTVHALLAARIDGLPREEKRVLQEAAVVGRIFWEEPVMRAIGNGAVTESLLRLERRGLVFARPTSTIAGQTEFAFKHALVRDVAYASLPKTRRARAHAEHAAWIEALAGGRVDEFAELIAHHYRTAAVGEEADLAWTTDAERDEVRSRAFEALVRAGSVAKKQSALRRAVELHRQALELAASDMERVRALEEVGDDLAASYQGNDAVDAYREAIAIQRNRPDAGEMLARLCSKAGRMIIEKSGAFRAGGQPTPAEADELVRMGLEAAANPETRAWLLSLFGQSALYWRSFGGGDPIALGQRIATAEEGLALAESLGTPDLLTMAARTLTDLYVMDGRQQRAVETARRQLEVVDRVRSATERALTFFQVAVSEADLASRFDEALSLSTRSYEMAKNLAAHDFMHSTYGKMLALYHLGRWDELLAVFDEHMAVFDQERGVLCFAVRGGPFLGALVMAHRGEVDSARALAMDALGDAMKVRPGIRSMYAEVLLACGDIEEGRAAAEAAWTRDSKTKDASKSPWDRPLFAVLEARVRANDLQAIADVLPDVRSLNEIPRAHALADRAEALTLGAADPAGGKALFENAIATFDEIGIPYEAARTREMLAALVVGSDAEPLLAAALVAYEALGAKPHAERVRAAIGAKRPPSEARGR
jgi:class 3 adenylate cyclase/tetratricopeptide (TPR) repeat protein